MNVVYFDVGGPNKFLEEYAWWYNKVQSCLCLLCAVACCTTAPWWCCWQVQWGEGLMA